MADINSYALSLELSLGGNATEVLRGVSNLVNDIEKQVIQISKLFSAINKPINNINSALEKGMIKNLEISADITDDIGTKFDKLSKKQNKDIIKQAKITKKHNVEKIGFFKKSKNFFKDTLSFNKKDIRAQGDIADAAEAANAKQYQRHQQQQKHSKGGFGQSIGQKVSGLVSGVGLGELAQAATLTGVFSVGILDAVKSMELYHTVNFRALGSMKELQRRTRDLSLTLPYTTAELDAVTIALRNVGAGKTEIKGLTKNVAFMNRTTGASVDALARMAHQFTNVSGSAKKTNSFLDKTYRIAERTGLTGDDLSGVLSDVGNAAVFMGSTGTQGAEAYASALFGAADAAKKMGIDTSVARETISGLMDPSSTAAFIGGGFDMTTAERFEAVQKEADRVLKEIEAKGGWEKLVEREKQVYVSIAAGMGATHANYMAKIKMLAAGKTEEFGEDAAKLEKPLDHSAEAAKAAGPMRDTEKLISDTFARLQQTLEPLFDAFADLMKLFRSDPIFAAIASWGIIAVAVGGVMFAVLSLIAAALIGILTLFGSIILATLNLGVSILKLIPITTAWGTAWSWVQSLGGWLATAAGWVAGIAARAAAWGVKQAIVVGQWARMNPMIATGVAATVALAAATGLLVVQIYKTVKGYYEAQKQIKLSAKARWDATRALEAEGKILHDRHEAEERKLKVLIKQEEVRNAGKPTSKKLLELQNQLVVVQQLQGRELNANNKGVEKFSGAYNKAVQAGDLNQAIMEATSREAAKMGMSISTYAKDHERVAKLTKDVTAEVTKQQKINAELKKFADERALHDERNIVFQKEIAKLGATPIGEHIGFDAGKVVSKQADAIAMAVKKVESVKKEGMEVGVNDQVKEIQMPSVEGITAELKKKLGEGMPEGIAEGIKKLGEMPIGEQISSAVEKMDPLIDSVSAKMKGLFGSLSETFSPFIDALYNKMKELFESLSKEFGPLLTSMSTKVNEVIESRGIPEPITPIKITDETARPTRREPQDTNFASVNDNLTKLIELFSSDKNKASLNSILRVLEDNLPRIAEHSNTGLSAQANQWVT